MNPKESTLAYYADHLDNFTESTLQVDMGPVYQHFLPLIELGGRLLDAGCGTGRDARHFKSLGYEVEAFDASPELADFASELLQQPVPVQSFQTFSETDRYLGIWCCASLLHVPKTELPDALQRLSRALREGGYMYLSFKYGDGERVQNGRFFCDQNEASFAALI